MKCIWPESLTLTLFSFSRMSPDRFPLFFFFLSPEVNANTKLSELVLMVPAYLLLGELQQNRTALPSVCTFPFSTPTTSPRRIQHSAQTQWKLVIWHFTNWHASATGTSYVLEGIGLYIGWKTQGKAWWVYLISMNSACPSEFTMSSPSAGGGAAEWWPAVSGGDDGGELSAHAHH